MYTIKLGTTLAKRSLKQLQKAGFSEKLNSVLANIQQDPTGHAEKLVVFVGRKSKVFSRRLKVQHRVVYQVFPAERIVEVLSVWGHYVGA